MAKKLRIIIWLRNDLRIHDNALFDWVVKKQAEKSKQTDLDSEVVPVFCFDPRNKPSLPKARFDIESVIALREKL